MRKLLTLTLMAAVLLVSLPALAALPFSDDFNDGNDNGWTRSDGVPFFGVVGGEYACNNFGGGTTYATREDVTLPGAWKFDVDMRVTKPTTELGYGGVALVEQAMSPWGNYLIVNVLMHQTLGLISLQVHWGTGANASDWIAYTQGDPIHLTAWRDQGSNVLHAKIVAPSGTLTADSIPLAGPLASKWSTCVLPAVQLGGGASATYYYDNVLITPEPGSLLALGLGMGGLLAAWRKRSR